MEYMLTLAGVSTQYIINYNMRCNFMSKNVYAVLSQNSDILEEAKQNESVYLDEWKSIPWNKIEQSIYKLQYDIACAEIDGN